MAGSQRSTRLTAGIVVRGRFHQDLAWGTGGVAVAIVPGLVCGFGRRGEIHLFDTRDGEWLGATVPISDASLGIAHGAVLDDHLVYGFNRGGYRLWTLPISAPAPYSLRLWYGTKRLRPARMSSKRPSSACCKVVS